MSPLILKRAPIGDNEEDYDVLENGVVVVRLREQRPSKDGQIRHLPRSSPARAQIYHSQRWQPRSSHLSCCLSGSSGGTGQRARPRYRATIRPSRGRHGVANQSSESASWKKVCAGERFRTTSIRFTKAARWARMRLPAAGLSRSGSAWLGRSQKDGLPSRSRGVSWRLRLKAITTRAQRRGSLVPFLIRSKNGWLPLLTRERENANHRRHFVPRSGDLGRASQRGAVQKNVFSDGRLPRESGRKLRN